MAEAAHGVPPGARHPRPWLAALFSFLLPGLGQAYLGLWWLAALLALPILAIAAAVVATLNGAADVRNVVLSSSFLVAVIAVNILLFGWRAFAIAHAGLSPRVEEPAERRSGIVVVGILVAASLAMHAWVGSVAQLDDTLQQVFGEPLAEFQPAPDPVESGETPDARPEPVNQPLVPLGRDGADQRPARGHRRASQPRRGAHRRPPRRQR